MLAPRLGNSARLTAREVSYRVTPAELPVQNGMSWAVGIPDAMTFWIDVDAEIARLKDDREPDALWLDELLPLYAKGMSPAEAARHIVSKRYPEPRRRKASRREGSLIKLLLDGWREWEFRRALRQTGRA